MSNEVGRLFEAAKRILGIQHLVQEFSQLENVDVQHIERLLQGFSALFDLYNNLNKVPSEMRSNMQNTDTVKKVLLQLPPIDELISLGNNHASVAERFHDFLKAVYEMKLMAKKGGELREEHPDTDVLELDEKHPEVLLFHLEDGISDEGLAFATVLHLIEMYLNRINEALFKERGFEARKDWLTDMSMEFMIANDALPNDQRNQSAHDLYVLVNEKLGWIKGYSHIHPQLREAALLDPIESNGFESLIISETNFNPEVELIDELVAFDKLCFQESPTGLKEHTPPLLTKEDIISGIQEHNNQLVVLRKDEQLQAVLQVCKRKKMNDLHIMSLAVNPESRGKGFASTLLYWVDVEAERLGTNTITLRVDPDNQPALDQYLHHGFIVVGVREGIKDYPNVVTFAMTKSIRDKAQFVDGDEKKISVKNLSEIQAECEMGYRGVSIEGDKDSRILVMKKITDESKENFVVWK